ncbi:guanine nucleotide-releasing factor 2 isoform X2 [Phlebotomus argentipes]|uniref:guanine nucleotide-releasing factor 2 isoform X2 n=1 Tax=Phlebotomus argentipes TaxID=94469 RepID=UPI0028930F3A|nr:guanine nucleotide-releasing factor 2 isoform X2 [Phlebotomus argentipes]
MPEFDESFLAICSRNEQLRRSSYDFVRKPPKNLVKLLEIRIGSSGHKGSLRGTKLARRARSFKDDFLEKISQIRTPTNTMTRTSSPSSPRNKSAKGCVEEASKPAHDLNYHVRQVKNSLTHFKDVISKRKLEMLPGNGTVVLESIANVHTALQAYGLNEQSNALISAKTQVYASLGRLIKLCDEVLLAENEQTCAAIEPDNVQEVMELMEAALENLLQVSNAKLTERVSSSSQSPVVRTSSNTLQRPMIDVASQRTSLPDIPLTPRERDILEQQSSRIVRSSHSTESILRDTSPPPKPPLPSRLTDPPPLPPKPKQRAGLVDSDTASDLTLPTTTNERSSWRSKSPEDNSSLLSASAGSLDSALNQSREDDILEPLLEMDQMALATNSASSSSPCREFEDSLPMLSITGADDFAPPIVRRSGQSYMVTRSSRTQSAEQELIGGECVSEKMFTQNVFNKFEQHSFMCKTDSVDSAGMSETLSYDQDDEQPPELPQKTRRSIHGRYDRHKSIYDNMPGGDSHQGAKHQFTSTTSTAAVFTSQHHQHSTAAFAATTMRHQSVFEPRQLQKFHQQQLQHESVAETQDEKPPPLPIKKKHMFQSVAYSVMAYMEIFGNCTHASQQICGNGIRGANLQERSVSMMPSINHVSMQSQALSAGSNHSVTVTTSSSALLVRTEEEVEKPPALPPKQSRLSSKTSVNSDTPPQSPRVVSGARVQKPSVSTPSVVCSAGGGSGGPQLSPGSKSLKTPSPLSPPLSATLHPHLNCPAGVEVKVTDQKDASAQRLFNFNESHSDKTQSAEVLSNSARNEETSDEEVVLRRNQHKKKESMSSNSSLPLDLIEEMSIAQFLVFKKEGEDGPDVKGGHLDALIIHATKVEKNFENAYGEAFLTTFRTFMTPLQLIEKLTHRYNVYSCQIGDQKQRAAKESFALLFRVVNDLTIPDIEEYCLNLLVDFAHQLICNGNLTMAKLLRVKILEKVMMYKQHKWSPYYSTLSSRAVTTNPPTLLDLKSVEIAEQMTLLDSDLFKKIEIPEVLIWAQEQCEERSPNLTRFTEHFNKMSYWARSQILKQEDAKERERYVIKFIKIMKHLRKIKNFNSYLALLSALDSALIRRLEWQKTITDSLKDYCALIDPSSSFRAYRLALAETTPPCIPYIGLVLQDLTFVHIGNQDYLSEGIINFSKRWQQYNIVVNMKRFKKSSYPFKKKEHIIGFFDNFENYLDEDAMWQISENIKPREGKRTYKR